MIIKLISHSKCYVFNQTRVTLFGDSRLRSTILFIKGGGQGGAQENRGQERYKRQEKKGREVGSL